MRKAEFGLALVVVLALTAPSARAAEPPHLLTLNDVVRRAADASFEVRMARADAASASADGTTARSTLRPLIGVSATAVDANEPQLGMPVARQAYGAATLSIPLYAPGQAALARSASRMSASGGAAVLGTVNDAVFAAVQAYRRVQLADAVTASRRLSLAGQQGHLRATEERIAAGKAARYLALRDRSSVASAAQAAEDAAAERDEAASDLAVLLDSSDAAAAVEPLTQIPYGEERGAVVARAIRARPTVISAERAREAAQFDVDAARRAYLPTATLTSQSYTGTSSPMLGRGGGQVQITASLPLADGGARSAAFMRAQARLDRATAGRDQAIASARRDVANALREFDAASRNVDTARTIQADAQEQARLAELRAALGKGIEAEVLDALAIAGTARETLARSIARYDIAVAAIHHAAGDVTP